MFGICNHQWNKPTIVEQDKPVHICTFSDGRIQRFKDILITEKTALYTCKKCSKIKDIRL